MLAAAPRRRKCLNNRTEPLRRRMLHFSATRLRALPRISAQVSSIVGAEV
jgi:hypothetical protein